MDIEVFEVAPGQWAYRVGGVFQEWKPDCDGYVPMTESEARECAEIVSARISGG